MQARRLEPAIDRQAFPAAHTYVQPHRGPMNGLPGTKCPSGAPLRALRLAPWCGRGQGRAFGYTRMRNTLGTRSDNRENPGPTAFSPYPSPIIRPTISAILGRDRAFHGRHLDIIAGQWTVEDSQDMGVSALNPQVSGSNPEGRTHTEGALADATVPLPGNGPLFGHTSRPCPCNSVARIVTIQVP